LFMRRRLPKRVRVHAPPPRQRLCSRHNCVKVFAPPTESSALTPDASPPNNPFQHARLLGRVHSLDSNPRSLVVFPRMGSFEARLGPNGLSKAVPTLSREQRNLFFFRQNTNLNFRRSRICAYGFDSLSLIRSRGYTAPNL